MKIINGSVYTEDYRFSPKDICIKGEYFDGITDRQKVGDKTSDTDSLDDDIIVDAKSDYVIPGLIDVHVHGCHNSDFCDATYESISDFLSYEASVGVTSICPTTMTVPEDKLLNVARVTGDYFNKIVEDEDAIKAHKKEASFLGINMEGPFISPEKKGSQELSDIKLPDVSLVRKMQDLSGGKICMVDIAPERDGAMDFIKELKDEVVISIAHTASDYDTAVKAMELGALHVTHLYNAMNPYHHRDPGVVGAVIDNKECYAELITDGIHHHSTVDRSTFTLLGDERVVIISDSMRAVGMPDGEYEFGGHKVYVKGRRATLSDGTIAASVSNLYECMITCIKDIKVPIESAVRAATINAARSVRMDRMYGSITKGKYADALIIDKDTLELKKVILRGNVL